MATAAGAGLRWGEVAGLRADALDLDGARLSVIRTVTEVGGHTALKPFPKSAASRRTVPLPSWLVPIISEHRTRWPSESDEPVFANEVGAPLRQTLFRSRIWRPSLVRAGLLGEEAVGGAVRSPYTRAVAGSNPAAPTDLRVPIPQPSEDDPQCRHRLHWAVEATRRRAHGL